MSAREPLRRLLVTTIPYRLHHDQPNQPVTASASALALVADHYVSHYVRQIERLAAHASRTEPTLEDAAVILRRDMNIDIAAFEVYLRKEGLYTETVGKLLSTKERSLLRRPQPTAATFSESHTAEVHGSPFWTTVQNVSIDMLVQRPAHLPSYCPPMPRPDAFGEYGHIDGVTCSRKVQELEEEQEEERKDTLRRKQEESERLAATFRRVMQFSKALLVVDPSKRDHFDDIHQAPVAAPASNETGSSAIKQHQQAERTTPQVKLKQLQVYRDSVDADHDLLIKKSKSKKTSKKSGSAPPKRAAPTSASKVGKKLIIKKRAQHRGSDSEEEEEEPYHDAFEFDRFSSSESETESSSSDESDEEDDRSAVASSDSSSEDESVADIPEPTPSQQVVPQPAPIPPVVQPVCMTVTKDKVVAPTDRAKIIFRKRASVSSPKPIDTSTVAAVSTAAVAAVATVEKPINPTPLVVPHIKRRIVKDDVPNVGVAMKMLDMSSLLPSVNEKESLFCVALKPIPEQAEPLVQITEPPAPSSSATLTDWDNLCVPEQPVPTATDKVVAVSIAAVVTPPEPSTSTVKPPPLVAKPMIVKPPIIVKPLIVKPRLVLPSPTCIVKPRLPIVAPPIVVKKRKETTSSEEEDETNSSDTRDQKRART